MAMTDAQTIEALRQILLEKFEEWCNEWENLLETKEEGHDDYYWHGAESLKDYIKEKLNVDKT